MKTEEIPVAETKPPALNVRRHPDVQLKELERAVVMFGQTRPIVVDEHNTVLVGNGLVEVYKRLGRPTIHAIRIPGMTEAEKHKLMLADNKIFDLGLDDYDAIMSTLRSLDDLDVPGFDAEVLRRLTATSADVEATAAGQYGTLAPGAQQEAAQRIVPPGSTDPGVSAPSGSFAPDAREGIICPKCGHLIPKPA